MTRYGENDAVMANITVLGMDENEIRKSILKKNTEDCKTAGINKLLIFLAGKTLDLKKEYEDLGIKFNPDLVLYHKDI